MCKGSLLLDQEYIRDKEVFKVSEKLSKDDVLAMGRYIPLMLEDLREEKSERYMQLQVKWDMYKILRDFIQNFYDSVPNTEFNKRFSYEYNDKNLIMKCTNASFNYEWLLHIGASSKTNTEEKDFAGYFGEGFKVAALCAMRDYNLGIKTSSSKVGTRFSNVSGSIKFSTSIASGFVHM